MASKQFKVENEPLWKEASALAERMYEEAANFPEEEKWGLAQKLRGSAADCMMWVSLAVGNPESAWREHEWSTARKFAITVKTLYRFAGRQKIVELDPAVRVRLDNFINQIEGERIKTIEQSKKYADEQNAKELKPWLKKYEIWKQISKETKRG